MYSGILSPLYSLSLALFFLFLICDKHCQVEFPPTDSELDQNENLCKEIINYA